MSRKQTSSHGSNPQNGIGSSALAGIRVLMAFAMFPLCLGQSCDVAPIVPGMIDGNGEQVLGHHPEAPMNEDPEPVARTETATGGTEGEEIVLDGSGSYDPLDNELSFLWEQISGPSVELHDAGKAIAWFIAPSIDANTTLAFVLTVSARGTSAQSTVDVLLLNAPPTVEEIIIHASLSNGDAPLSVDFSAIAGDGQAMPEGQYHWNFGDETTGAGAQVNHVFSSAGVYTVALCITIGAASSCSEKEITTNAPLDDAAKKGGSGASPKAQPSTHKISGQILANGIGVSNLAVSSSSGASAVTDALGNYQITVPHDWTGTVSPSTNSYTYDPSMRTFSLVKADVTGQNYAATAPATVPTPNVVPVIVQNSTTSLSTTQNTSTTLQLSATDSDAASSSLTWNISNPAQSGTASVSGGSPSSSGGFVTVRYVPNSNFTGSDAFAVQVQDGKGGTDSIAVSVTVTAPPTTTTTSGKTYYVAISGSDSSAGTQTAPFKTIQKAANTALAGDTVIIAGGTYNSGSTSANVPVLLISSSKNGTAAAPITFKSAPGEIVVLDGRGITRTLVEIRGSYVDIEGLEMKEALRSAVVVVDDNQNGVVDAHHVNVRSCYAHHNNHDVSFIGGAFRIVGPCEYVVFEDCMSHDNSIGFEFRESPTQTSGSMSVPPIAGNIGHTVNMPESQWDSWPGWVGYAARYCTIRRCVAFNNRLLDEHSDGLECRYAIECTIEDNVSFGNGDDNYDMAGATRCTVRRNIGFNANPLNTVNGDGNGLKIGVRGGLDNIVHHNILFNNPRAGLDMADTERANVYHNTCYNNGWIGIWFEADRATTGGATVLNNICKTNTSGDIGKSSASRMTQFNYNCVADANNHNWAIPPGTNGLKSTNPLFANEAMVVSTVFPSGLTIPQKGTFIRNQVNAKLGLASESPCVNTAELIPGITGATLGVGPDRGAVESR